MKNIKKIWHKNCSLGTFKQPKTYRAQLLKQTTNGLKENRYGILTTSCRVMSRAGNQTHIAF